MKKKTMRILSLIVAIIMVVSIIPLAALAEEMTVEKRKVGVVVYGAELTTVLTNVESAFHGDVDLKASLEDLTETMTKLVDGTGISVPEVEVSLTDADGKTYKMKEDKTIEIFTETTNIYVGFQEEVDTQLTKLENDLAGLKQAMRESNQLTAELSNQIDQFETALNNIRTKLDELKATLVAGVNDMKVSPNGILYRTYVTDAEVPVGDYTVKVERFSDTDENGNAITRDGYILYNDGLESGGSMFNTFRTFPIEVKEQGRFDHEIQFVGPGAGLQGELQLPEAFGNAYDTFAKALNKLGETATKLKKMATDSSIVDWAANLIGDITQMGPVYDWFKAWEAPVFTSYNDLSKRYEFTFPGLWCAESDAGFAFTNVDVAEDGIAGDTFLLVNRQETIDVLKLMLDLGKEVFTGILKATFGYTDEETGEQYESMLTLYTQLVKNDEEGQLSLDYDVAYNIIKNYIAVISDMEIMDKIVDTDTGDLLTPIKLRYPIPAILQAVSDENGKVEFTKNSNITLTWMLEIIPQVTEALKGQDLIQDNQILNLLIQVADYAADVIAEYGSKIINTLVYPFAQRLGLVGKKMASGEYIMFQTKTADDYWVNPLAYTMILTWENETWLYVTVADLGIIVPYFAEGWYDFVRNTTFAGTIDKFLSTLTNKEISPITDILTDKVDVTAEMGKVVTASLTAFVGTLGFDALGLDTIFANRSEFIEGLNTYLYQNGRTAQNLMIYVNRQAQRAKSVYAGYVTEDWYFYNLDKSPTLTATKLIDKSTKDISAAFVNPTASSIIDRVGSGVSSVVNRIGTGIESVVNNIKTQIKSTIGAAIQSAFQKVVDSAKDSVTNFFKNLFNRGAITFNA